MGSTSMGGSYSIIIFNQTGKTSTPSVSCAGANVNKMILQKDIWFGHFQELCENSPVVLISFNANIVHKICYTVKKDYILDLVVLCLTAL